MPNFSISGPGSGTAGNKAVFTVTMSSRISAAEIYSDADYLLGTMVVDAARAQLSVPDKRKRRTIAPFRPAPGKGQNI